MLDPETIKERIALIRAHDPSLNEEQAEDLAWSIGDAICIDGDDIVAQLDGKDYKLPASVLDSAE